jgi:transglutaminase-like putative cysteine protease
MRLLLLLLALASGGRALAGAAVLLASPPDWIVGSETPPLTPTPPAEVSYGYDYLLLDRQVNVPEQSAYFHTVYRITSAGSLQAGARLSWNYDPAYEQLTLHHLRVIRDGAVQERLKADLVKTIQQERDLDRHMLNGELTALVLLDDIRVGDVVDYAFTRRGWNPVFAGRYSDSPSTGWSVPVRHQRLRILVPADRPLLHQAVGKVPLAATVEHHGATDVLTWEGRDLAPIESEKGTPAWFDAYPFLQFTEYPRWAEVVAWALPLYAASSEPDATIKEKAAALTRGLTTDNDRTIALLQFVQQEVRYLGMELGAGSYRPTPPAEVLARRFGDCKDKALLFCTLMRAAGLTAWPALLNTDYRGKIDAWLPSPGDFDHVIACVPRPDGGYRWYDPTRTHQQGDLDWRGLPDYQRALVIKPGETALTTIEIPAGARRSMTIDETFNVTAFDQPAQLHVTTRYTGTSADSTRDYFLETTPEQIDKDYVNYYASAYPGLTLTKPVSWSEDTHHNVVTVEEDYSVPKLWEKQTDNKGIKAEFYPKPIADHAVRPHTTVRSMPLAVEHPVKVKLTTTVNLPKNWTITPDHSVTEDGAFRASAGISGEGKVVVMNYTWESLTDYVPVDQVPRHVEMINHYRDSLGYTLTHHDVVPAVVPPPPAFRLNWMLTLVALVTLTVTALVAVRVIRHQPAAPPELTPDSNLAGLGGWLILVGIGVTLRPLLLIIQGCTAMNASFHQDTWDAMTTPGNAGYQSALGPLIVTEVIGNLILIVGSVLMLILFYGRKHLFPATAIALMSFSVLFLSFDDWASHHLIKIAATAGKAPPPQAAQAIVQAAIWIPYMLISRRVKATFTR